MALVPKCKTKFTETDRLCNWASADMIFGFFPLRNNRTPGALVREGMSEKQRKTNLQSLTSQDNSQVQ